MWDQVTRGLAVLFSLRAHTFIHRATQASDLTASRTRPNAAEVSPEQVLGSTPQAQVAQQLGKTQTASLQWPGEGAAELHHLNAYWKALERIAGSTIRISCGVYRIRGRKLVKKKTTHWDLYSNILLKLFMLHFRVTYPSFLQGPAEHCSHLARARGDSANTAHSHSAAQCAREDNRPSVHRSHFIWGMTP